MQPCFLRLDVNIRSAYLHGIAEHSLQQLDHRRIFGPDTVAQGAEVDIGVTQFLGQFPRQAADLFGAPVDAIVLP